MYYPDKLFSMHATIIMSSMGDYVMAARLYDVTLTTIESRLLAKKNQYNSFYNISSLTATMYTVMYISLYDHKPMIQLFHFSIAIFKEIQFWINILTLVNFFFLVAGKTFIDGCATVWSFSTR